MLISLYWVAQTVKGVMQTTVCGTVACWWFQPTRPAPVRGSLFRASTVSFGSICFGALIVSVVQATWSMLGSVKNCAQRRGIAFVSVLFDYVSKAFRYFNMYAFCYVAAYGLDFVSSGGQVVALFEKRFVSSSLLFCLNFFTVFPP
jgi:hypothetical protein